MTSESSEKFIQLDLDEDTEHFLAYSTKLAKTSFKHRFILPRLLSNRSRDYDSLHKWNLAESFLEREVPENLCLIFAQFLFLIKAIAWAVSTLIEIVGIRRG